MLAVITQLLKREFRSFLR